MKFESWIVVVDSFAFLAMLFDEGREKRLTVVFHLRRPIRAAFNVVSHSSLDEARTDAVDSDTMLRPLHGERMSLSRQVSSG